MSDKVVIAPNRWFNVEGMNARALQDTIPDDWICIDFQPSPPEIA